MKFWSRVIGRNVLKGYRDAVDKFVYEQPQSADPKTILDDNNKPPLIELSYYRVAKKGWHGSRKRNSWIKSTRENNICFVRYLGVCCRYDKATEPSWGTNAEAIWIYNFGQLWKQLVVIDRLLNTSIVKLFAPANNPSAVPCTIY